MGVGRLKKQWIIFSKSIVEGMTNEAAYLSAYPNALKATARTSSNKLLHKPEIQEYIEELREELRNKAIWSISEILQQTREIAESPETSQGNRLIALKLGAQILGGDKKEVKHTGSVEVNTTVDYSSLSDEELDKLLEQED
jgi:hypothetical protein